MRLNKSIFQGFLVFFASISYKRGGGDLNTLNEEG